MSGKTVERTVVQDLINDSELDMHIEGVKSTSNGEWEVIFRFTDLHKLRGINERNGIDNIRSGLSEKLDIDDDETDIIHG